MHSFRNACVLLSGAVAFVLLTAACGDDDSSGSSVTPTATLAGSPTASPNPLVPPLEGPERVTYLGEQQDFRLNPDYALPEPNTIPVPSDTTDPILNPPVTPDCPSDWKKLQRLPEGFEICYPADWYVLTDAYKNAPNESRWYAGGVFKFPGEPAEHQLAHVSMYVIPKFAQPFPYIKDCPTPYRVTFDGQPSIVCASFPATSPEARLVSYHVYRENLDYFFNIALYNKWDDSAGAYTDETDSAAFDTALKVVQSVKFLSVPSTVPSATGSPAP